MLCKKKSRHNGRFVVLLWQNPPNRVLTRWEVDCYGVARAEVAQLAEHSPEKAGVDSSILSLGTIFREVARSSAVDKWHLVAVSGT